MTTKPGRLRFVCRSTQVWEEEWEGCESSVCLRWAQAPQVWETDRALPWAGRGGAAEGDGNGGLFFAVGCFEI